MVNAECFAEWQRRQGNQVLRSKSSFWYEAGPRVFQAFPYSWIITPSEQELYDLIIHNGIIALRYSTPIEAPEGKISYHIVRSNPYSLDIIRKKSRKCISDGLGFCKVEEIPLSRLAQEGWCLQQKTLIRQKRTDSMGQKGWEKICKAAEGIPGFQAWGAIVGVELAASLLTMQIDDIGYILYSLSQQEYFNKYVNHALFFAVTVELLKNERINSIFYTVQSLDAPSSVDDFKFRIGLEPRAVRQRVIFHPLLAPLANKFTHHFINQLLRLVTNKHFLAKAEGMLRFNLEGKLPSDQQHLPDCLNTLLPINSCKEQSELLSSK